MKTFTCNIAQPGLFAGPVVLIENEVKAVAEKTVAFDADRELTSFQNALSQLKNELNGRKFGDSNSEILEALAMILEDESFTEGVRNAIEKGHCSAGQAVEKQTEAIVLSLEASGSDYLRGRCEDIRGISRRLSDIINNKAGTLQVSEPSAFVSVEINPLLMSLMEPQNIGALVSDKGSPNSHASIIAGNMGVPYLFGAEDAIAQMKNGQTVIVDGYRGVLILDPDSETLKSAVQKMKVLAAERERLEKNTETFSCRTKIMANVTGPGDISELLKSEADGIGLLRTELIFLNSSAAPSEEQQLSIYTYVLDRMKGKDVIIRTMDLGSDKIPEWMEFPKENNPALGLRGARVSLEHRDLLNTQLRALLRAAVKGNLKIMFPMIISEWEVDELKKAVDDAAKELENEGLAFRVPELGIMIETPSAVLIAERLAEKVSFFSIGTNDLTQYTLGIDRENKDLDRFFDPRHESVLRLIEMTVRKAHEKGIPVGICGQLAADPDLTRRLVNCQIDELSVPPTKVKAVRGNVFRAENELYSKTENEPEIAAVADGGLIPMNDIPDETFAEGILGPCIAILPENGNVYSPVDGKIKSIADTKHAIVIEDKEGVRYLVHMGIDTVNMKEKAFDVRVNLGEDICEGDLIAVADLEKIKSEGFSTIIVTVMLKG